MNNKKIKVEYVRNENFIDDNHLIVKYIDEETQLPLGYYRNEQCYAPYKAEHITREELLRRIGRKETNYEKVKYMTLDQMSEFFAIHFNCKICPAKRPRQLCENCIEFIKSWLLQEVEE